MKITHIVRVVAALAMGTFSNQSSSAPPSPSHASLSAQVWNIQYSPGMSPHPIAVAGGWYFDFPAPSCGSAEVCSVHYVSTPVRMPVTTSGHVNALFQITTTGSPVFNYRLNPGNTCDYPAHTRFYLQRAGDDLSGRGKYEFYRWFSNEMAYELATGSANLTAALSPDQWTSVFGKKGDHDTAANVGFVQALQNLANVGFVFGGGCYYGHGVNVSGGTARFSLQEYSINE